MRIIVLSDNRTINTELETEHGLCVYLETENHKILLDTGASDVFIRNAAKLNVDLSAVDYVFISHGHADHIGGLPAFLDINSKAKIILSSKIAHAEFYSKRIGLRKISIDFDFDKIADRLILVDDELKIDNAIWVYKNQSTQQPKPLGNNTLFINNEHGELEADDFDHELIFVTGTDELFVFTGCAHQGVLNILQTVKNKHIQPVRWVLGGFHLLDANGEAVYENLISLENISRNLSQNYPMAEFFTGHCTGENVYEILKKTLEFKLIHFFTGYKLEI